MHDDTYFGSESAMTNTNKIYWKKLSNQENEVNPRKTQMLKAYGVI